MLRLGVTLLFIGVLAFVLPLMNIQFRLITLLGDRPEIRIAFAAVGALLIVIAKAKQGASARKQVLPAAPPVYPQFQQGMPPQAPPPQPVWSGAQQQPPARWAPPPPQAAAMGRACRRCGNVMPPVNTFCTSCGTPLT